MQLVTYQSDKKMQEIYPVVFRKMLVSEVKYKKEERNIRDK